MLYYSSDSWKGISSYLFGCLVCVDGLMSFFKVCFVSMRFVDAWKFLFWVSSLLKCWGVVLVVLVWFFVCLVRKFLFKVRE